MSAAELLVEEFSLPVFPCSERKQPLTANGFKDASRDPLQVQKWWRQYPSALVGIPTGEASGFFVLDVDPDGKGWYERNASRLDCGYIQRTRRGYHLFYRHAPGIRNSAGRIARGIDVRGEGGYVIAWGANGLESVGSWIDIGPAPDWLLAEIACSNALADPEATNRAKTVVQGRRNDFISREAFRLRKQGRTIEQITNVLLALNETTCEPPLCREEVLRVANGKASIAPDPVEDLEVEPLDAARLFLTADALRGEAFTTPPPVIEGLLLQGATLLHGPAKKGKSWFLLQMGIAIDAGEEFLGRQVTRRDALYVGAEDTSARFKARLERLAAFGTLKFMNREALEVFGKRLRASVGDVPLTVPKTIESLWELAGRPAVIVIDTQEVFEISIGISHGKGGESVTRRDYQATSSYDGIANKLGIAIVLVGHWGEIKCIRKATTNPHECLNTTKARLAGVITSITLGPLPNQEPGQATRDMQLSIRSRDLPGGDQFLWVRQDDLSGAYRLVGEVREVLLTEAQAQLYEALMAARKDHGPDYWCSAAEIAEELGCSVQNVRQMVSRVRKAAIASGKKPIYQGYELESKPNKGYRLK